MFRRIALALAFVAAVLAGALTFTASPAGAIGWTCQGVPGTSTWGCWYVSGNVAQVGLGAQNGDRAVIDFYTYTGTNPAAWVWRGQTVDTSANGVNTSAVTVPAVANRANIYVYDPTTGRGCNMYLSRGNNWAPTAWACSP